MSVELTIWGLVVLSLLVGSVAGTFLTFSDFVMRSLLAARAEVGAEAMAVLNRVIFRSIFIPLLIGLIPVTALVGAYALYALTGWVAWLLAGAGVLYVVGVFVVSAVGNIPMNNRLDRLPLGAEAAQAYWPDYVRGWLRWNHIRSAASFGAAACYTVAAVLLAMEL
ncbi:Integral membrane protein [Candidatus Rhodobacter oscarellae]|uniref:Integral membrane protein n=1 Tax=Candidatus Rhodobacter oscarellae TaxID=1675527 RepID=A0A0J9E1C8_9RHOB|nr:anthrone oxygenase family protein [Candidatus Rhodobacter lobularis]KMW56686.1 Integral membrane protein [Candidatus Rhodobacter lobularis]